MFQTYIRFKKHIFNIVISVEKYHIFSYNDETIREHNIVYT